MQQIAQQVLAGQTLTVPQRVGMYEFQRIERVGSAVSFYESRGSWGFWFNYSPSRTNGNLGGPWSASSHD